MSEHVVETYVFTNKDLENVDFDYLNNNDFKAIKGSRWYYAGFYFRLKDGRKLAAKINYDDNFVLKSKKYGEFNINLLGKILADFIKDNDELYIINRELNKIDYEWGVETGVNFVNYRFDELLWCEYHASVAEVARKVLEMAANGEKFITIIDYGK